MHFHSKYESKITKFYSLSLETQNWIGHQIAEVYSFALGNDLRMFLAQQPTDVREEESSGGIMGTAWKRESENELAIASTDYKYVALLLLGISFGIFVMDTMIASPMDCTILECNGIEHG